MEYRNSLIQTGYVTFYKKVSEKVVTISLGIGTKVKEGEYKTGFLQARGSSEILGDIKKGDKVKLEGFLSFSFWTPEGSEKEFQKPQMVITKVLEVEKDERDGKKSSTKSTSTKPKTTKKEEKPVKKEEPTVKEEEIPEVDLEEDDIPF